LIRLIMEPVCSDAEWVGWCNYDHPAAEKWWGWCKYGDAADRWWGWCNYDDSWCSRSGGDGHACGPWSSSAVSSTDDPWACAANADPWPSAVLLPTPTLDRWQSYVGMSRDEFEELENFLTYEPSPVQKNIAMREKTQAALMRKGFATKKNCKEMMWQGRGTGNGLKKRYSWMRELAEQDPTYAYSVRDLEWLDRINDGNINSHWKTPGRM
jgi:hypothetical protein